MDTAIFRDRYSEVADLGLVEDHKIGLDLAALRLARLDYPDRSITPYLPVLNDLAGEVANCVTDEDTVSRQAMALARSFTRKGFHLGNGPEIRSSDMMRTIGTRSGNQISIAILYVSAARRAGLWAELVELNTGTVALLGRATYSNVIYFSPGNAFHFEDAKLDSTHHCSERTPLSNRMILVNLLGQEAAAAVAGNDIGRAITLYAKMCMVIPNHGPFWQKKAELEIRWGDTISARKSLCSLLELTGNKSVRYALLRAMEGLKPRN